MVYYLTKNNGEWWVKDFVGSNGFKSVNFDGPVTREGLSKSILEPDKVKRTFECYERTLADGRQRSYYYTSLTPGRYEPRIAIFRKIDQETIAVIIRRDTRQLHRKRES